ncbi:MAG TPA: lipoyl(octanoyl) transferase LipB [Burkholderiales bacterium]|nr:lipoyl(octanoyl) transferase LipB [Burkholderiales bacterium]
MRGEAYNHKPTSSGGDSSLLTLYSSLCVKRLGLVEYLPTWHAMQDFTARRNADTEDELWLLQHLPVYTLGLNGKQEHLPQDSAIQVIKTDRGGQITYHGPGQIIAYLLLDMGRLNIGARGLVRRMEQSVIDLLESYGISAQARIDAPGVYVNGSKIAALGLRIKQGCCYHGLALNVDMDLRPFRAINPCGHPGMQVTQLRDLGVAESLDRVSEKLIEKLIYHVHKT